MGLSSMASIERTAYPRLKHLSNPNELAAVYTPTDSELEFARLTARGDSQVLSVLVLLKTFQRLGYFPRLDEVPAAIVSHIRSWVGSDTVFKASAPLRSLYRYQEAIRAHLGVSPYDKQAQGVATRVMHAAAQVMENPADLVNVAIEELVKERYELPAFSTLDRLARHVRSVVNTRYYQGVYASLSAEQRAGLDLLLDAGPRRRSEWNRLKAVPKSATVMHMRQLQERLSWLMGFGDVEEWLAGLLHAKVVHLAAQARALDIAEMGDVAPPRRYTMLLCLLVQARAKTRDALVEMFIKRMGKLHNRGKERLEELRKRHRETTENLIEVLGEILRTPEEDDCTRLRERVRRVLDTHGGTEVLTESYEAVSAHHGNNYLPLLWSYYRSHRSTLFRMVRSLQLRPTTQDRRLVAALEFLLEHEQRRGEWLPYVVDLGFAREQWQRTVLVRREHELVISRRHFEVCVFSYLASELKTGDLCIEGSEQFADYREHLLPWEECEPMVAQYCDELGLEPESQGFVGQLKAWLSETAEKVDRGYRSNSTLVIGERGEPVLKKLPRQEHSPESSLLREALSERMPERSLLDVLCNVEHWTNWTRHFGPLSGSEPKLERARERYILTTFGYGCNLGPVQTARHTRGTVSAHMLGFMNRRHITTQKLDAAIRDIINRYHRMQLPKVWGSGKVAAADVTQ